MIVIYILTLVIVGIASIIGFWINNKKSQAIPGKMALLYYLAFSIVISVGGLTAMFPPDVSPVMIFVLLQLAYLGLGFLASYVYKKKMAAAEASPAAEWSGVFFILVNAVIGSIGFTILYNFLKESELAPYLSLSVVTFVLPQFIRKVFHAYLEIPQPIHKLWYYPVGSDNFDFDDVDLTTIYMLELEYSKSVEDHRLINTKLRAPTAMNFGDWYRSFIENYNHKYDSDPINYLSEDGTPQGWMFYVKPSLLGTARYIDPELTIAENKLNEKHTIVAKRVGYEEEPYN